MKAEIIKQLWFKVGANGLPYGIPLHPNLVHFTLGLFIIGIIFDAAGVFFPLEKPILKFLGIASRPSGFFSVGWYNVLGSAAITFFTVGAGFFEMMLAEAPVDQKSDWGLTAGTTMLLHGLGGILLLAAIVGMAVWRGLQRYRWRKDAVRQVQWSYLAVGFLILVVMFLQGTLGAQLGDDFGIHITAAHLLRHGQNPNLLIK